MAFSASIFQVLTRIAILAPLLGILYILSICIYRLTFHPFAKYPGPFLAKVTNLYGLYHAWKQDLHVDMWRCHDKYGEIVRYAPNRILFNRADSLHDIYGPSKNVGKGRYYHPPRSKGAFNTHNTRDKALHGRKRRVLSQGFSESALRASEPIIISHIDILTQQLLSPEAEPPTTPTPNFSNSTWNPPRNMSRWAAYLAYDVISDVAFGSPFDMLHAPTMRWIESALGKLTYRANVMGQFPELFKMGKAQGRWLNPTWWFFGRDLPKTRRYEGVGLAMAMKRTDKGYDSDRKDIMHFVLNAKDPETGEGFSKHEIWAESNLIIGGGGDTTSTAIASTFFYLTRNPTAYSTLRSEIHTAFPTLSSIRSGPTLTSCIYLKACTEESLRLAPPTPGAMWREVLAGGISISASKSPVVVPAGYEVAVPIYAIHHNPIYYPEPFSFIPERWIASPSNSYPPNPKEAFCPFSIGPRACVAKNLAYLEITLTIARVIWAADFRGTEVPELKGVGEGGMSLGREGREYGRHRVGEFQMRDQFTTGTDGPWVEFRGRKEGEREGEAWVRGFNE